VAERGGLPSRREKIVGITEEFYKTFKSAANSFFIAHLAFDEDDVSEFLKNSNSFINKVDHIIMEVTHAGLLEDQALIPGMRIGWAEIYDVLSDAVATVNVATETAEGRGFGDINKEQLLKKMDRHADKLSILVQELRSGTQIMKQKSGQGEVGLKGLV
jgi:hypothetical protein